MAKSVSLPFCTPVLATVQGSAAIGLGINGHPTAYNGVLNQLASLTCIRRFLRGYTTPQTAIPGANIYNFSFFERHGVTSRFGVSFFEEEIKQMLDEGYYVYFTGVDDFYIPGKSWYGIRHMAHDGILCGYDDDDRTFSIASYDINWVFNLFLTPQECFIEGINACYSNKQYGAITAYKLKPNTTVNLDLNMILRNVKQYMDVTIDKVPLDQDGPVSGIAVHDLLAMYIDKLKDGSIPSDKMDWRAIRPVWEHKRCMLDRIKAVEGKKEWDSELSDRYAPLVDEANRVRGMYAMYHKNQKAVLLDRIKNGLLGLREKEFDILQAFIKRLEAET